MCVKNVALGPEALYGAGGALHGGVSGVRLVAQGIEEEHVEAAEHGEGGFRDIAMVRQVGRAAEAKAVDHLAAVQDGHGLKLHAEEIEGGTVHDAGFQLGDVRFFPAAVEDVLEAALDGGHGFGRGEDGDLSLLPVVEGAHVVEAHQMVGVGVREEHRIQVSDARAQRLRAEIGRGIDQYVAARVAQEDRGPEAVIPRIGGSADVAMTADGGNADARPRAQHRDLTGG